MARKDQTLALTVQSSVPDALKVLDQKISAMKHIQDSVYVTSGKIQTSGGQKDIKEEKNVTELVKCLSSVMARAKAIDEAYEELGYTNRPVTKVDGSTVEEWVKDIKLRIAIIENKERLDELISYKKEWEELMDRDDRKQLLIDKMSRLND